MTLDLTFVILLVMWSFASYRLGRFIALDALIKGTREKITDKLTTVEVAGGEAVSVDEHSAWWDTIPLWKRKIVDLIGCPFCVTAYTTAGVIVGTRPFIDGVPLPVLTWLACWTGALLCWARIDSE